MNLHYLPKSAVSVLNRLTVMRPKYHFATSHELLIMSVHADVQMISLCIKFETQIIFLCNFIWELKQICV